MSADLCVVIFGIRFDLSEDEVPEVETRRDERMLRARDHRLKCYFDQTAWQEPDAAGNVTVNERSALFIGAVIGMLGPEGAREIALPLPQLQSLIAETGAKLVEAAFPQLPALHVLYTEDHLI
jgi:hypothetical protein